MPDTPSPDHETKIRGTREPLQRVLMLARVLRGPGGCPWDREQTVESLTPYLQEETYEVIEAVGARDREAYREEMGDLIFLVGLLAQVAEDEGWGTLDEVATAVVDKLIRRHPHVFGGGKELESEGALRQWEEIKRAEHGEANKAEIPSSLGHRPVGLPALTSAYRISEKAGAVGFQWPDVHGAITKVEEELQELCREIRDKASLAQMEHELGDVLYSIVNVARYLGVDPERALRSTTAKFSRRFRYIEKKLHEQGKTPETATLEEMDAFWNDAKAEGIV